MTITAKGKKLLTKCYENLVRSSEVMFWDLGQEDKNLCIQLLKGLEIKHSKLVHEMKSLSIDQVHEKVTGVKVRKRP